MRFDTSSKLYASIFSILFVTLTGAVSAATINVPADWPTIQEAIDAASAGDTINVAAGTYVENIAVDKSLTIAGESQAATIIIPAFSAPNPGGGGSIQPGSSNIVFVEADNVTIQDLTVDGDNPGLTSGIVFNGADIDARNGIITNHSVGSFTNLTVDNVLAKNIYLRGIYYSTGPGSFTISNNTVTNVNGEDASIPIMNWAGTGSITGNTVTNSNDGIVSNHSTGVTYSGNNVSSCGTGIHTDNNTTSADQIINNIVSDCGYGIMVFNPSVNVLVSGNTITNSGVGLCSAGSYSSTPLAVSFANNVVDGQNKANSIGIYSTTEIWGYASGNQDASFTNNFIQNTANALLLASELGFTNSTTAFENSITGNTLGVKLVNDYTEIPPTGDFSLSMSCNWWGSDDVWDVQTAVAANIDFLPFLSNGTDDQTGIIGFQPVPNSCDGLGPVTVYDDDPLTTGTLESIHMTIQDGIDAAAGGYYINVAPGTYVENVVIDVPDLTLQSTAGRDLTIIDNPIIGAETPGIYVWSDLGIVTVDGFTANNFRNGIVQSWTKSEGTSFIVTNCKVIPENNSTTPYLRNGIQVSGDGSQVIDNIVVGAPLTEDWSSSAIGIVNASNVLVQGNTVTGSADIGIDINNYNSALVEDITMNANQISGAKSGVTIEASSSNSTPDVQNVFITNNTLENSQIEGKGVNVERVTLTNLTVTGNEITGNDFAGIRFSDSTATIAGNILINDNDISGNTSYGIFNGTTHFVDATLNRWGSFDGPEDLVGSDEASVGSCFDVSTMVNAVDELGNGLGNAVSGNVDYCPWIPGSCCVVRGDIDHLGGAGPIDIADLVYLVDYMFDAGPEPPCFEEADVDGSGTEQIDIADLVYLVDYMFAAGPEPPPCL